MTVGLVLETCVSHLEDTHRELPTATNTKPGPGGTLRKREVPEQHGVPS